MRKLFLLFTIGAALSCSQQKDTAEQKGTTPKQKATTLLHNKQVLILGNSITENGRYVDFLEYYLRKNYPNEQLNIISIGLGSETVNGLTEEGHPYIRPNIHDRVDRALDLIKPEIVLACYGMNDGLFSERTEEGFKAYKEGIIALRNKIETAGAELILITPTPFDPDAKKDKLSLHGEPQGYATPFYDYNQVLGSFAQYLLFYLDEGLKVINLHGYMNPILAEMKQINPDTTFIPDAVHPNELGHFYMAKKILLDLYPQIEFENDASELQQVNSDPMWPLVKERRKIRSRGWLEYIGFTRGETVKSDDINSTKQTVTALDLDIQKLMLSN
ncbi:MAG: hypothetical protein JXQ90_09710 [Cyclobacteriaceae bacterium]